MKNEFVQAHQLSQTVCDLLGLDKDDWVLMRTGAKIEIIPIENALKEEYRRVREDETG